MLAEGSAPIRSFYRWDTPDPDILNCLDDMLAAEDGRVILAVADTPATFLYRREIPTVACRVL